MFVNFSMHRFLLSILLTTSLFAKDIIAVLDLEQIGLTPQEATILTQRLTTKLIAIDRYQVVERNNMDKILKEQKFQNSGCTDSECAVEIGQLLNTDFIILGSVNKFGSTYAVDARLIDVGLGKSLISAEFSMKGEIDILLTTGMTSIAKQLCDMPAKKTAEPTQVVTVPVKKVKPMFNLDITTVPGSAKVYINDKYSGFTSISKRLKSGNYNLSIYKEGYDSLLHDVEIKEEDMALKFDLVRQQGYLHTAINPPEALITIDGETVANNSTSMLNTGSYKLTAKLTNYYLVNESVTISKDDTSHVNHTLQYGLDDYKKLLKNKKPRLYAAIASTGLTALSYFISGMLYNQYVDAENAQDATDLRNQAELFYTITNISGAVSAGVWGYTLYNYGAEQSLRKELGLDE